MASFKNVNEDEILQIEGVQYVPMVGKVTGESMNLSLLFTELIL